jgi:hypothetical protein
MDNPSTWEDEAILCYMTFLQKIKIKKERKTATYHKLE